MVWPQILFGDRERTLVMRLRDLVIARLLRDDAKIRERRHQFEAVRPGKLLGHRE
jgi:hypothetical protein